MLLGRREEAEDGIGSEENSSSAAAEEKEGSIDLDAEEKDNDSPYRVKITLD